MAHLSTTGGPALSPPPVAYPALTRQMSSHQRTQGYTPSPRPPAAPLFAAFTSPDQTAGIAGIGALHAARCRLCASHCARGVLDVVRAAARRRQETPDARQATLAVAQDPSPYPHLRTVILPRFLSIARANTARNLETYGLLLGREVVGVAPSFPPPLTPNLTLKVDSCSIDKREGAVRRGDAADSEAACD
ncbi:hypothetical protein B0H17DRAFT_320654 [Mycena rosella]|uniref:Uncharacterized protein n=1 Tax=Mycena rosella TaxID=1033263 RepID=A0AAD7CT85_MYCRO|nr:hypothetical protein B0H17DRAFT_320654 [Mycena rosella]